MLIKWSVTPYSREPERREYDSETKCYYIYRSGKSKVARRDAKTSTYYRYFDSEAEAVEYIRLREENKINQSRVDQIKWCGVELFDALNKMLDHFEGQIPLELFELAESAIKKAKGL